MKTNFSTNEKALAAFGIIALAIIILIFGPLFSIWSWNQLFGDLKTLDYTFWNWLAVIGMGMFFKHVVNTGKKN